MRITNKIHHLTKPRNRKKISLLRSSQAYLGRSSVTNSSLKSYASSSIGSLERTTTLTMRILSLENGSKSSNRGSQSKSIKFLGHSRLIREVCIPLRNLTQWWMRSRSLLKSSNTRTSSYRNRKQGQLTCREILNMRELRTTTYHYYMLRSYQKSRCRCLT